MRFGAGATVCQMLLDFRFPVGIQLAVEIGLDQLTGRCAFHLGYRFIREVTHSSKRLRARESRDITVPIGTEAASAISLYDSSSSSRMMMTSRYSRGSDSMQFRSVPNLASSTKPASALAARSEPWAVSSKGTAVTLPFSRRRQVRHVLRTTASIQDLPSPPLKPSKKRKARIYAS